jgi:hypothetical protein
LANRQATTYDEGYIQVDVKYNPARRKALDALSVRALAENWPCGVCHRPFESQDAAWVFRDEGKNLLVHRDCALRHKAAWEGKEYLGLVIMEEYVMPGMPKPKPSYNPEDDPHAELPPLAA